jgi:hypothetical protein
MKTKKEIRELWNKYHTLYQDAKKLNRKDETSVEVCRVIEYILS